MLTFHAFYDIIIKIENAREGVVSANMRVKSTY